MLQSSSSEKKLVKPFKNCFFGSNLQRKKVIMGHAQDEKSFLAEITEADHELLESFYFINMSYVLTEFWIFLYLEWCFSSKKCNFQLKQLWSKINFSKSQAFEKFPLKLAANFGNSILDNFK